MDNLLKQKNNYNDFYNTISKVQPIIEFKLDGTIITANEKFLKTANYTLDEIQGKHHRIFCEKNYANSQSYKEFWKKLGNGEFIVGEFKRLYKGDKEAWINASYNPIFNADNKPIKLVKFVTDFNLDKLMHSEFQRKINSLIKEQAIIEFKLDEITIIQALSVF